ncbi:MAG: hypothetical protein AB9866_23415 [Syntrophobacteraceae bacterium]
MNIRQLWSDFYAELKYYTSNCDRIYDTPFTEEDYVKLYPLKLDFTKQVMDEARAGNTKSRK